MVDVPTWVTLTDGEEVIWQGRPTLVRYLGRLVVPLLLVALGVVVWLLASDLLGLGVTLPAQVPATLVGALAVLAGLAAAARVVVAWWTVSYLLTTEEVYRKQGVVSREVQNLRLDRIQNTTFTQSLLGRVTSHGDVHIETAGTHGTEITFEDVPNPQRVVGYITDALDRQSSE